MSQATSNPLVGEGYDLIICACIAALGLEMTSIHKGVQDITSNPAAKPSFFAKENPKAIGPSKKGKEKAVALISAPDM
jgi:hypothetical protein